MGSTPITNPIPVITPPQDPPPVSPAPSPKDSGIRPYGAEGQITPEPKEYVDIVNQRRTIGYFLCTSSIVVVLLAASYAFSRLDQERIPTDAHGDRFELVMFATHAIITVALVYFGYQLLRAGERMIIPHWWVRNNSADVLRVMLGISAPGDAALKVVKDVVDATNAVMGKPKEK